MQRFVRIARLRQFRPRTAAIFNAQIASSRRCFASVASGKHTVPPSPAMAANESDPQAILAAIPEDFGPGAATRLAVPVAPPLLRVADCVKVLYLCEPRDALFNRFFTEDAVFEDPLGKLGPLEAFKGLSQLFAVDRVDDWTIKEAGPEKIIIDVKLQYTDRSRTIPDIPFGTRLTVKLVPGEGAAAGTDRSGGSGIAGSSGIAAGAAGAGGVGTTAGGLADEPRIAYIKDEWNDSPLLFAEDGFRGKLAQLRRIVTGAGQKAFVRMTGGTGIQTSHYSEADTKGKPAATATAADVGAVGVPGTTAAVGKAGAAVGGTLAAQHIECRSGRPARPQRHALETSTGECVPLSQWMCAPTLEVD